MTAEFVHDFALNIIKSDNRRAKVEILFNVLSEVLFRPNFTYEYFLLFALVDFKSDELF